MVWSADPGYGLPMEIVSRLVYESGGLDLKSKEMIAAAASAVGHCPYCTKGHIPKAQKQGALKEEIAEAFRITSLISSGTQIVWMKEDYERLLGDQNDT